MTQQVTPVVICIDVEPEERHVDRVAGDWLGVEETASAIEGWREELAERTGRKVRFAWFWRADPQIAELHGDAAWGIRRYRDLFSATSARGDAHGVHPHTWRYLPATRGWIQDTADPQWVERCIDMSITTFREVTGTPCRITRLGDRALDGVAYRRLRAHRVRVDLSVEPGEPPRHEDATAASPDFALAPTRPYRPRRDDVARASRFARGPVLLPLSATATSGSSDDPRTHTVYPWQSNASSLVAAMLDDPPRYLAFAVRSDISIRPDLNASFEAFRTMFARHPRAASLSFVTPLEAVDALRTRGAASFRSAV